MVQAAINGITMKPKPLKRWALSLQICNQLVDEVAATKDGQSHSKVTVHKDEMKSLTKSDAEDRNKIRLELEYYIDHLDRLIHPNGIVNIVTGRRGSESVTADKSVAIGKDQMETYEAS